MRKRRSATCSGRRAAGETVTQAELLRDALAWAIKDDIFAKLPRHGNTSWQPRGLVSVCIAIVGGILKEL